MISGWFSDFGDCYLVSESFSAELWFCILLLYLCLLHQSFALILTALLIKILAEIFAKKDFFISGAATIKFAGSSVNTAADRFHPEASSLIIDIKNQTLMLHLENYFVVASR